MKHSSNSMKDTTQNGIVAEQCAPTWKLHLDQYPEKRALTFKNDKDLDAAVDLLWTPALKDLPHALAGGDTIIVPAEAVHFFKNQGLRFRSTKVQSVGDLSVEEINRIRKDQGPY